jgi:thiamine biosynthesis lipoprotein
VSAETHRSFECFGGTATVHVGGAGARGLDAEESATRAEALLLEAHGRLSRFLPDSELCRLNADERETVPVSELLLEVAAAARWAGLLSDGLVDATLVDEIERAGYRDSLAGDRDRPVPGRAPTSESRTQVAPSPTRGWSRIAIDRIAGTVTRPPGLRIDSGGIAKGLLADLVGATLREHAAFAVDCCGDIRVGGAGRRERRVLVEDPAGGEPLHELAIADGAAATSGIGRRCWVEEDGVVAHHLLDPATGAPAFTGVLQATAQAPTAFLAEVYSKHALLSGAKMARERLPYGGVLVLEDGAVEVVEEPRERSLAAVAP